MSRPLPHPPASVSLSHQSSLSFHFSPLPSYPAPLAPKPANSYFQLPPPVTVNGDSKGRVGIERNAVPPLVALTAGLAAISSNQPRAVLLFIGAAIVILGIPFVAPPGDGKGTHPILSTFLRRLPEVFTAAGCTIILLGIGAAFPNELALVPLFLFISFAALALLFGAIVAVWMTTTLYAAALFSLVAFVILAFTA